MGHCSEDQGSRGVKFKIRKVQSQKAIPMQNSLLQCIECSYDEVHFLGNSNYISKWAHFNTCSKLILLYLKKSKFYSPIPPWIMNLAIHEIQNPFSLFSLICEHMFIFFTVFFPPLKLLCLKIKIVYLSLTVHVT